MSRTSRLFWMKMPKDFRKRHDVKILTKLHGDSGRVFYEDMMCESLDHDGYLRFSEDVPYSEDMLAAVFDREIDFVTKVMNTLKNLKLVVEGEDGTLFMTKVPEMTGSETSAAKYMRERRKRDDTLSLGEFENVELTKEELESLKEFYPSYWRDYIEKLSAHKKSKGKVYESDYATIKQWLLVDVGELEETW